MNSELHGLASLTKPRVFSGDEGARMVRRGSLVGFSVSEFRAALVTAESVWCWAMEAPSFRAQVPASTLRDPAVLTPLDSV